MSLNVGKTERGFALAEWEDRYGNDCSVQDSSLATEACLWLGIVDPKVQVMVPGEGWKDLSLPEGASIHSRMHLTQEQVKDLLPLLVRFVETGSIQK